MSVDEINSQKMEQRTVLAEGQASRPDAKWSDGASLLKTYHNTDRRHPILFLMNGAKPPRGGEYLTRYLVTHLRKDIFHPIVAYAEEGVIVDEIKQAGIETIQTPLGSKITHIYPRDIKLYNPLFIMGFLWDFMISRSVSRVCNIIKKNGIELIYCADNLSKLTGGIAGKISHTKVVGHCHDDFQEDMLGRIMRMIYLMLLHRILTVSDKVKFFFDKKDKKSGKAVTVYNGIDVREFNPDNVQSNLRETLGITNDTFVIGSLGVLERDKGHRALLEAILRLKEEGISNLSCLICGEGPEELSLRRCVHEKGLDHAVVFLGFRRDVPMILGILDAVAITSLTIESFSMVAIEGMAMKVPIIASRVGGLPEVVEDGKTGLFFPPGDVEALADSIRYLIQNPAIRLEMGEKGRKRVIERFAIEDNVRKTEEIFLELLRSKS